MPPYLPFHRELVYLSGAGEVLGGLASSPNAPHAAGFGLVLLLLAVWPANLQMLLDARAAASPPGGWPPRGSPAAANTAHRLGLARRPPYLR